MLESPQSTPLIRITMTLALCALLSGLIAHSPAQASRPTPLPVAPTTSYAVTPPVSAKMSPRRMMKLVNDVRSKPQTCGDTLMPAVPAVPAVRRNKRLQRAAQGYAREMARQDWYGHDSPDGSGPSDRIDATGYQWSKWGENIAAGYDTAPDVLAGWLASPGHCTTLMGRYRHLGFGHGYNKDSTYGHYWVQDFASPR